MSKVDLKSIKVDQKIKFPKDRSVFTVQARNENFIICTTPAPKRKTVDFSIIDIAQDVRGDDNMIFHSGYADKAACEERLQEFIDGKIEVSHRNRVPLEIEWVK